MANETERLESRRAKNREAAERMRRRRREEHSDLERTVRDLTALVDGLTSKLALSEAENTELRRRNDAQQTPGV
jgi:septal ring factor EnvC (AmiA/AmiB activator)